MKSYSFPMISEGIDFGNGLAGDVQHVAPKEDAHDAAAGIGNAYGAGERSVKAIEALSVIEPAHACSLPEGKDGSVWHVQKRRAERKKIH